MQRGDDIPVLLEEGDVAGDALEGRGTGGHGIGPLHDAVIGVDEHLLRPGFHPTLGKLVVTEPRAVEGQRHHRHDVGLELGVLRRGVERGVDHHADLGLLMGFADLACYVVCQVVHLVGCIA